MNSAHYYARQVSLPEVGKEGQEKLGAGKCLIVGAGGLGSAALYYLAAAGVGTLGICDADCVDITNLHRQILYSIEEIGSLKAEAAAQKLRKLNPFITTHSYSQRVTAQNIMHILPHYDLLLDCTDNFQTKFLLNDASFLLKVPLIRASIYRFEGQLHTYLPQRNEACLRCLWPEIPQESCVGNCADVGVLGPLPGFFGVVQAMEALKFFLKLPLLEPNTLLIYDLISHSQKKILCAQNRECPLCGITPKITHLNREISWEIDPLSVAIDDFQLVDIREKKEVEQEPLQGVPTFHLPLSAFDENKLDRSKPYLFFCHRGMRSNTLVSQLRARGWNNAYSSLGGILRLKNRV
jgi:sulfur-carrier protein adenylyltransferase/sulfurtransferase